MFAEVKQGNLTSVAQLLDSIDFNDYTYFVEIVVFSQERNLICRTNQVSFSYIRSSGTSYIRPSDE